MPAEQAMEQLLCALDTDTCDIEETKTKLRKVVDGYLSRSKNPSAKLFVQAVSDVCQVGTPSSDIEMSSEDHTDDENRMWSDWPENPVSATCGLYANAAEPDLKSSFCWRSSSSSFALEHAQ